MHVTTILRLLTWTLLKCTTVMVLGEHHEWTYKSTAMLVGINGHDLFMIFRRHKWSRGIHDINRMEVNGGSLRSYARLCQISNGYPLFSQWCAINKDIQQLKYSSIGVSLVHWRFGPSFKFSRDSNLLPTSSIQPVRYDSLLNTPEAPAQSLPLLVAP